MRVTQDDQGCHSFGKNNQNQQQNQDISVWKHQDLNNKTKRITVFEISYATFFEASNQQHNRIRNQVISVWKHQDQNHQTKGATVFGIVYIMTKEQKSCPFIFICFYLF